MIVVIWCHEKLQKFGVQGRKCIHMTNLGTVPMTRFFLEERGRIRLRAFGLLKSTFATRSNVQDDLFKEHETLH